MAAEILYDEDGNCRVCGCDGCPFPGDDDCRTCAGLDVLLPWS